MSKQDTHLLECYDDGSVWCEEVVSDEDASDDMREITCYECLRKARNYFDRYLKTIKYRLREIR